MKQRVHAFVTSQHLMRELVHRVEPCENCNGKTAHYCEDCWRAICGRCQAGHDCPLEDKVNR